MVKRIDAILKTGDLLELEGRDVAVGRIGQGRLVFELVNECGGWVGLFTAEQINARCELHPQTRARVGAAGGRV